MAVTKDIAVAPLLEVLKKYWGFASFRPLQQEAMSCILAQQDSVVVLPTGGGKSLCFQAPALLMPGIAMVVTPLLSLMKDQVDALRACGVPAACLNGMQSSQERSRVMRGLHQGEFKLLYVAPERLNAPGFADALRSLKPSFFAIDEAHCISTWGHEFRPDYRRLTILREMFPEVGIHTFTATATPRVRKDIARQLGLREPEIHIGAFDRPNLTYRVERKVSKWEQICAVLERHKGESGIIYCISRKNVEQLSSALHDVGYRVRPYHAGMDDDDRKRNQEAFVRDEVDIIVATVAFGMGIDKSDVRYVLHAAAPKSLENYQQEAGRAGRDGLPAECVLLWGPGDFVLWKRIMRDLEPEARQPALNKLAQLSDYCAAATCRHRALVSYFGQSYDAINCRACDICLGDTDDLIDVLLIAQKILSCVARLPDSQPARYVAEVLNGSPDEHIRRQQHDQLSTFGILREYGVDDISDWIAQLSAQGFCAPAPGTDALEVTESGRGVLRGRTVPRLTRTRPQPQRRVKAAKPVLTAAEQDLFESLRDLRRRLADHRNVPAFVVFSDAVLVDMVKRRPGSLDTFLQVNGVGEAKRREFGRYFVDAIAEWCRSENLPTDVKPGASDTPRSSRIPPQPVMNPVERTAYELFDRQMSLDAVCSELQRARSTVVRYLENYLRQNRRESPVPWVDEPTFARICASVARVGGERLRPIYDDLDGSADYDAIRIGLACLDN